MKTPEGYFEKRYVLADGSFYRVQAKRLRGWWAGEVFRGASTVPVVGYTVDDDELENPEDGDEVCDLTWKRFGLER